MCGRFSMTAGPAQLIEWFDLTGEVEVAERFNIAPSQSVAVIRRREDGSRSLDHLSWGLVPSWARDKKGAARMINARSETVAEKPSFRAAFKRRRCLVPADGFFEWMKVQGGKQPVRFCLRDGGLFALAGIWERWEKGEKGEEPLESFSLLTCSPNGLVAPVHNRMPVILSPESFARWLDPEPLGEDERQNLLVPFPAKNMDSYPVSRLVNSPANDTVECIQRMEQPDLFS